MRQLIDNKIISESQHDLRILVDNVIETLARLIQRRLQELRMSKAELARRVGVSRSYIVNMANETAPTKSGQYQPGPEVVAGLATHLEIPKAEILTAIGYGTPNGTEILDGVRISFDEKKFTKAQRDKLTDTIKILAAGMLAEAQNEPDPQDR